MVKHLAPGIVVFDNIFPTSMDFIESLKDNAEIWKPAEVLVKEGESGTDYKARDTDLIMLPHHLDPQDTHLGKLSRIFHAAMKPALDEYMAHYYAKIERFENPQLLRYGKEQKFHNHIDDHPMFTRRISLTYYFNDEYEGGDIEFSRFGVRLKAQKNQLLIFPSNFIYNHEVHPVTEGTRYVMVQWMA